MGDLVAPAMERLGLIGIIGGGIFESGESGGVIPLISPAGPAVERLVAEVSFFGEPVGLHRDNPLEVASGSSPS